MAVDWSDPAWGQVGRPIHVASWAPDKRHEDVTEEETC